MTSRPCHAPACLVWLSWLCGVAFVSADLCHDVALPLMSECFDGQPAGSTQSCYQQAELNGTEVVFCRTEVNENNVDFADSVQEDYVLECRSGAWEHRTHTPGPCHAPANSVWRLVSQESTLRGWWINELKFYSDSLCSHPLSNDDVMLSFAAGPMGAAPDAPHLAFDGNVQSYWEAPCLGTSTFDLCGCRIDLAEGWSSELQRCVAGGLTDGLEETTCAEIASSSGHAASSFGCPASDVWIGIHLARPTDIGCVRILQFDAAPLATSALSLEAWAGTGWQRVRQWNSVERGRWETLQVRESCPPITQLPRWAEVTGHSGAASHGDRVTISCIGGMSSSDVFCEDGRWSDVAPLTCSEPVLPSDFRTPSGSASDVSRESLVRSSEFTLTVGLLVPAFVVALAAFLLYALRNWARQREWRRLCNQGAAAQTPPARLAQPTSPSRHRMSPEEFMRLRAEAMHPPDVESQAANEKDSAMAHPPKPRQAPSGAPARPARPVQTRNASQERPAPSAKAAQVRAAILTPGVQRETPRNVPREAPQPNLEAPDSMPAMQAQRPTTGVRPMARSGMSWRTPQPAAGSGFTPVYSPPVRQAAPAGGSWRTPAAAEPTTVGRPNSRHIC